MTEPDLSCIISEGVLRGGVCAAFLVLIGMQVAVTLYETRFNIIEDVREDADGSTKGCFVVCEFKLGICCSTSITLFSVSSIAPPLILLINCVSYFLLNVTVVDAM